MASAKGVPKGGSAFARRLATERLGHGLSQRGLDEKAGLSVGTTSRLEAGERGAATTADTMNKLAAALGRSATWLRTGREAPQAQIEDRYPTRARAIAAFRERCEEVIRRVQSDKLQAKEDPGLAFWTRRIARMEDELVDGRELAADERF